MTADGAAAMTGGLADPARDAAVAFRAALDAMARPGSVRRFEGATPPDGLCQAAAVLLLCLADAETPLWLAPGISAGPAAEWLRFHTNAPFVTERGEAMFGVGAWDALAPFEEWAAGDPAYPDRSATLIVQLDALTGGPALRLRGPGIEGSAQIAPRLPRDAAPALKANAARYPMGCDLFLAAGAEALALPRSTRLEA